MKLLSIIIFSTLILSCQSANENKAKILGNWNTVKWTIDDSNRERSNKMDFQFNENDRYKVDYGSEKEEGKYWFEDNELYTIEDGSALKKVEIEFIGQDSMLMKMNRAGQRETVQLIRVSSN